MPNQVYTLSPNVPPGYLIQVELKQNISVPIKNLSQIDSIRFSYSKRLQFRMCFVTITFSQFMIFIAK